MSGRVERSGAIAVALVLGLTVLARANGDQAAVVHPAESTPGAHERYVLRVPNERDLPSTRVELLFPGAVNVVSFADVPGWELEVTTAASGQVTRAVWTGTLPAGRFVEFPFVAVNPRQKTRLTWRASQVYVDGERAEWDGPEGSATPASFTWVREPPTGGPDTTLLLSAAALVIALLALGLALRKSGRSGPARRRRH